MSDKNQEEFDKWNPEEAKKLGSLKGIVELKIDANYQETKIEFGEPVKKKIKRTAAKVVESKLRNKSSLF